MYEIPAKLVKVGYRMHPLFAAGLGYCVCYLFIQKLIFLLLMRNVLTVAKVTKGIFAVIYFTIQNNNYEKEHG